MGLLDSSLVYYTHNTSMPDSRFLQYPDEARKMCVTSTDCGAIYFWLAMVALDTRGLVVVGPTNPALSATFVLRAVTEAVRLLLFVVSRVP